MNDKIPKLHHFPLYPAKVLVEIVDMTNEDRGCFFLDLLKKLIAGEKTGHSIADEMIEEAQLYYAQKRFAGSKGGKATQQNKRALGGSDQAALNHRSNDDDGYGGWQQYGKRRKSG